MARKRIYTDEDKTVRARKSRQKYRDNTGSGLYDKRHWEGYEDDLIMEHSIPDGELAVKLQRSATAIQKRRWTLRHFEELVEV